MENTDNSDSSHLPLRDGLVILQFGPSKQCLSVTAAQIMTDPWWTPWLPPLTPLTTSSTRGASLTCLSAACALTPSSPCVAPEQSRACESRLACRQSTLSQTVNPMIEPGTQLLPAPVSALLYTLASANGKQMQGNGKPCQLHAGKQPHRKPSLCASQWPVVLQKHDRHLEGPPFKNLPPTPLT